MDISLLDYTVLIVQISQKKRLELYDGAVRCCFIVDGRKGSGYVVAIQEENSYVFAVVLIESLVGRGIAQAMQANWNI